MSSLQIERSESAEITLQRKVDEIDTEKIDVIDYDPGPSIPRTR